MLIQTKNKNRYYFSEKKKEVILLSPVLLEIIAHKGDMASLSSTDTETVSYYQKKYALLKEAGYFDPAKENKDERITRDLLERALANSTHVIFETTENCNLRCKYCGYSEIYSTFEQRGKQELPFAKAKTFLDFMLERWNSSLNVSYNKRITLSFYGGEPLMNFSFIEQVVDYVSTWKLKNNYISFSMTTNGTLLDKYIDFLVKWKFNLFISIDGNKYHNAFRVYSNGKESFEKVFENISLLKKRYPSYFKKNVNFNSVFHKRSSYVEVSDFFQKEFDKSPLFLPLNTFGVIKEKETNSNLARAFRFVLRCPEREYLVWEYLCDFIDIEDKEAREMLSIIGSAIVMFEIEEDGCDSLGKAIKALSYDGEPHARFSNLLMANTMKSLLEDLRVILYGLRNKDINISFQMLLNDLVDFKTDPQEVKVRWAKAFFE